MTYRICLIVAWFAICVLTSVIAVNAAEPIPTDTPATSKAFIDGNGPGWKEMGKDDFEKLNCPEDTWKWEGGTVHCSGSPVGVLKSKKSYTNLELVAQWRHLKKAGNSGIFLWASEEALKKIRGGGLPEGIEVQVLDLGYTEAYEKATGKKADWFTCHGDVFPTGNAQMTPFPPVAPDKRRSFPTKELTKGVNEWNHYYVRAINGEVRLWVNGEEVSGGTGIKPATGFMCLESEGSPVDFANIRIRELP